MSNNIENGGPAFPIDIGDGMSLRDKFAGMAMQGLLSAECPYPDQLIADRAYAMVEAMGWRKGRSE